VSYLIFRSNDRQPKIADETGNTYIGEAYLLVTCYLMLTGVEAVALIAPSAAGIETVLEQS